MTIFVYIYGIQRVLVNLKVIDSLTGYSIPTIVSK